ncbi:Exoglucanase B precursor [Ruminococcus bromii]|nr:leucine-rich repeat protein [Ruminococcus bromii]PKD28174.1 Exoglucanase B precursor [Ruminococcus bromii]
MKTKIKCLTSVFLTITMLLSIIVVAPITVNASEDDELTYGDFQYKIEDDNSCTITDYDGMASSLSIPSAINGHTVKQIDTGALSDNRIITSVTIPNGVTTIGFSAFNGCIKLEKIKFSSNLDTVCENAFNNTKWFNNQSNGLVYVGKVAYKYKGDMPRNTKITVKSDTVSISESAFKDCANLTAILIPSSVKHIDKYAFYNCQGLTKLNFNDGIERIENDAFGSCEKLTSVNFSETLKSIGAFAFVECKKLSEITIPQSVTSVGEYAFSGCENLASVTVSDDLPYVGGRAFEKTKWLNSQPDGVVYIGKSAYGYKGDMPKNTELSLKSGITNISGYAFYEEKNLTSVKIPETVNRIGNWAFLDCEGLKNVNIPDGVKRIESWTFSNCSSLTNITVPDSVTVLDGLAFSYCTNLKNIELSKNLTEIGMGALSHCTSLENIDIPDSVIIMDNIAMAGCSELKSVNIGSNLKTVGGQVFAGCTSLEKVNVNLNNKNYTSENGIWYDKNKTKIILYPYNKKDSAYTTPTSLKELCNGYVGSYGILLDNSNLKTVTIEKNVAKIDDYAIGFVFDFDNYKINKVKDFTVKGYRGTVAESYAKKNSFNFVALDKTLQTPSISKLENTSGGIKISWNKVSGAYGYRVYQKTSNGWKRIKDTTATSYTDSAVSVNQTKTYTMRCVDKNGNTVSGYNSKGWSKKYTPVAPTISKLENTSGGIKLSWNKIAGVYGYRLYYKTSSGGWKRFKDTTATSFTDSGVSPNRTETYTIRCIDKNGNTVSGYNSKGWSKKYTPVAPTISKLENTSGGIKLSWNKIAGVYGYRLYYKTSSGGWKRFKDTTATSFTDSGVSPNRTETYTIRCIDKNGNTVSGYNSKGWSKKYAPVAPKITKLTNTSKGVSVTWGKVAGVYGYRLYRKYDGGGWTKVKDTTAASYTDSGAKKGKKVTYTLRCIDKNGKTISGYNATGWSITRK